MLVAAHVALGRLAALSLSAAQLTAPAAEALLRRAAERLGGLEPPQAAAVLQGLVMAPAPRAKRGRYVEIE